MNNNLIIEHTDKSKNNLIVPYRTYNVETSLALPGEKVVEWGTDINTNFLRLLEHFADTAPPGNALPGQLWYDSGNEVLKVKTTTNTYVDLGFTKPHVVPTNAYSREMVLQVLTNFLSVNGGHITGPLLLKDPDDFDHVNSAVSKGYVDSLVPANPGYIPLSGNQSPATGLIYVPPIIPSDDITHDSIAANKKYAESIIPRMLTSYNLKITVNTKDIGFINIIYFIPSKLINIFGTITLQPEESSITLPLNTYITELVPSNTTPKLKGAAVHVNTAGAYNANVTVDAKISGINFVVRKHNPGKSSNERPSDVHFTINGVLA
jgi:hypothetical protein